MTDAEEEEMRGVCDILHQIHDRNNLSSTERAALKKAVIALSLVYIHDLREKLDHFYSSLGTPLSEEERRRFRSMGIDPDESLPNVT